MFKRLVPTKCKYCDLEFEVEVICYNETGFPIPKYFVRKECEDCMKYQRMMYNQDKVFNIIEQVEAWVEDIPHDNDRYLVAHYARIMRRVAERKYSENSEIIKLYRTGNFMPEELATFFGKEMKEIKEILILE